MMGWTKPLRGGDPAEVDGLARKISSGLRCEEPLLDQRGNDLARETAKYEGRCSVYRLGRPLAT